MDNIVVKLDNYSKLIEMTNPMILELDSILLSINSTTGKILQDYSGTTLETFVSSLNIQRDAIVKVQEILKKFVSMNSILIDHYSPSCNKLTTDFKIQNDKRSTILETLFTNNNTYLTTNIASNLGLYTVFGHELKYYSDLVDYCHINDYYTEVDYNIALSKYESDYANALSIKSTYDGIIESANLLSTGIGANFDVLKTYINKLYNLQNDDFNLVVGGFIAELASFQDSIENLIAIGAITFKNVDLSYTNIEISYSKTSIYEKITLKKGDSIITFESFFEEIKLKVKSTTYTLKNIGKYLEVGTWILDAVNIGSEAYGAYQDPNESIGEAIGDEVLGIGVGVAVTSGLTLLAGGLLASSPIGWGIGILVVGSYITSQLMDTHVMNEIGDGIGDVVDFVLPPW